MDLLHKNRKLLFFFQILYHFIQINQTVGLIHTHGLGPEQRKQGTWKMVIGLWIPNYFLVNCHPAQPCNFSQICSFMEWYEFIKFWEILSPQLFLFNRLKIYLTDQYKFKLVPCLYHLTVQSENLGVTWVEKTADQQSREWTLALVVSMGNSKVPDCQALHMHDFPWIPTSCTLLVLSTLVSFGLCLSSLEEERSRIAFIGCLFTGVCWSTNHGHSASCYHNAI